MVFLPHDITLMIHCVKYEFLGAQAPLELAHVKNNNNKSNKKKIRKKFLIAITCSLLLLLAP